MKKIKLTTKIVIAVLLAIPIGIIWGSGAKDIKFIGDIFFRLIQMPIILLIMGQICEAVGNLNPKQLGKIGLKTFSIFLGSSLLAAVFAAVMAVVFQIGSGVELNTITTQALDISIKTSESFQDIILNFFPKNIIESMANGSIVQVIVFALIAGITFSYYKLEHESCSLFDNLVQFNAIILKMVAFVMRSAPIGIFALVASTIGVMGVQVLIPLAKYLLVFGGAVALYLILWMFVVSVRCKVSFIKLMKKMSEISLVAVTTTSSAVTLPTTLKVAINKIGISERVSKLVLPLGVSLNCNGSALHMVITVITIAQIYGVPLNINDYGYIIIIATMLSFANAVVPGAGLVSLAIIVPQLGLPVESIAIFAGVEWIVGMYRTILNVDADVFSAMLVAKSEHDLDYEIFNAS